MPGCFVSGHGFSRADGDLLFPSQLQPSTRVVFRALAVSFARKRMSQGTTSQAAEIQKQIPPRPEGLVGMTKIKGLDAGLKASSTRNAPRCASVLSSQRQSR